ncbi:IucA/IucC family siderophore biosynthesis protein [Legionella qingyii]|uniref:IucA/IucC family siderophore biosynthesis protein n=1 Tax=Legionella qingyii TaxID=2184757 RepID=A0A317U310_9GAMM|nr:IucA/IucC family protein [Legionella qingyii]PWY55638.1 IucA/IucC family siderophore biosynthesis protein [Legionella qingyii]RUR21767.1 IucA/IucC family siderophore biosynthesis protein [Legionella qingyii]RUR25305.1 IucA/IucC family siderophore biosynthesis protein [Legionella qingyii]
MILSNLHANELNYQLRSLLTNTDFPISSKQMGHFLVASYQQCFNRLRRSAISEGLIDKQVTSQSITAYLELLKLYSQKQKTHMKYWHSLHEELNESIANQALALAYQYQWHKTIKRQAKGYANLWSWLIEHFGQQQILNFLEQWGCIGHPSHPNFRAKIGFNRKEVVQYSPEFNSEVTIGWAAIHHSLAFISTSKSAFHWLFSIHFPKEYSLWSDALRLKKLKPEDYYPFPVHPWQWTNKLQALAKSLFEEHQFIINPVHQQTKPSMSFRTVMPLAKHGPHLKLAVGVHTTSSLRTVSPASVSNSSLLSQWINELLTQNQYYKGQLFLARDLAGINALHSSIPNDEKKHFGLIVRENPLQWIRLNQKLVPLASLFKQSPLRQRSLLSELIELSQSSPVGYFMDYCRCVLASQLHLLLCYGVALEAHQQNTLVIFQANRPSGLVLRDLGGIKICNHVFYDKVAKPTLHPDSTITCSGLNELTNKFIHGNLLSNLAYGIDCLSMDYKLCKSMLWRKVRQILEHTLEELRTEIEPRIHHWYRQQLLVEPWQQKCLLAMRLHENQSQDLFSMIRNPLSRAYV